MRKVKKSRRGEGEVEEVEIKVTQGEKGCVVLSDSGVRDC